MAQKGRSTLKSEKDLRFAANNSQAIDSSAHLNTWEDNFDSFVNWLDEVSTNGDFNIDPLKFTDRATIKAYVDANVGAGFNHLFTQTVNAQTNKIINLPDGTDAADSVNKGQMDAADQSLQDQIDELFGGTATVLSVSANSITWDADQTVNPGKIAVVELTSNVSTFDINNQAEDTEKILIVKQDGTGGRTLVVPTGYSVNGTGIDINSSGGAITVLHVYNGGTGYKVVSTRNTSQGGGSGSGVTDTYGTLGAMLTNQGSQVPQGIYRVTDGSGFTGINAGYVWVEKLSSSTASESDYKVIGAEDYATRIANNETAITTIQGGLDGRPQTDTWTPSNTLDFAQAKNLNATLTADQDIDTFTNASELYNYITLHVASTGFYLTFTGARSTQGQPDKSNPYSIIVYFDGDGYRVEYSYIPTQASQILTSPYEVDNVATPGNRKITFDDFADQSAATFVRANKTNDENNTVGNILLAVKSGGKIAISENNNTEVFNRYILTGDAIDQTTYVEFPVIIDSFNRNFTDREDVVLWITSFEESESTDTLQDVFDRGNVIDLDSGPNDNLQINSISGNVDVTIDQSQVDMSVGGSDLDITDGLAQLANADKRVSLTSVSAKLRANTSGNEVDVKDDGVDININSNAIVSVEEDRTGIVASDGTANAVTQNTTTGLTVVVFPDQSGDDLQAGFNASTLGPNAFIRWNGQPFVASDLSHIVTLGALNDILATYLNPDTFDSNSVDLDLWSGRANNSVFTSIPSIPKNTLAHLGWATGYVDGSSGTTPLLEFTGTAAQPTVVQVEGAEYTPGQTNRWTISCVENPDALTYKVSVAFNTETPYTNVGQSVTTQIVARLNAPAGAPDMTPVQETAIDAFVTTIGGLWNDVYSLKVTGNSNDFVEAHSFVDLCADNTTMSEIGNPTYSNGNGWGGFGVGVALQDSVTMDSMPSGTNICIMVWTGIGIQDTVQRYLFGNNDSGNNTFLRQNTDSTISAMINNNNIQNMGAGQFESDTVYGVSRSGVTLETFRDGVLWHTQTISDNDDRQASNPYYIGARYNATSGDADLPSNFNIKFELKCNPSLKDNTTFINAVKTLCNSL